MHVANEILSSGGLQERISIRQSTLTALDFDDNLFDAVYVNEALHYIQADEVRTALNELKRVIRPGGSLFVGSFPDHDEHASERECLGPWTHLQRRLRDGAVPYSKFKLSLLTLRYVATGKGYVIWQSTPF